MGAAQRGRGKISPKALQEAPLQPPSCRQEAGDSKRPAEAGTDWMFPSSIRWKPRSGCRVERRPTAPMAELRDLGRLLRTGREVVAQQRQWLKLILKSKGAVLRPSTAGAFCTKPFTVKAQD